MFRPVAQSTRKHDIIWAIASTAREWHDVIEVPFRQGPVLLPTIEALSPLVFENLHQIGERMIAVRLKLPCAIAMSIPDLDFGMTMLVFMNFSKSPFLIPRIVFGIVGS